MYFLFLIAAIVISQASSARLAGECASLCNDLRFEVLTLEMCREAKRTLPRPKVGDFCSTAMEQGFSDVCFALCMDQPIVNRVAQSCRSAAIEMPRPTVRRWCEHGYTVAFEKTIDDLTPYFQSNPGSADAEDVAQGHDEVIAKTGNTPDDNVEIYKSSQTEARKVVATLPITLDDNSTKDLLVHEGQSAEEAVVEFCRENVPAEVSNCIRQLLSVTIEKLAELSINA